MCQMCSDNHVDIQREKDRLYEEARHLTSLACFLREIALGKVDTHGEQAPKIQDLRQRSLQRRLLGDSGLAIVDS